MGTLNDSIINSIIFSFDSELNCGVSNINIGWSSGTIYNILYNVWCIIFSISSQLWISPSIIGHYGSKNFNLDTISFPIIKSYKSISILFPSVTIDYGLAIQFQNFDLGYGSPD